MTRPRPASGTSDDGLGLDVGPSRFARSTQTLVLSEGR